MRPHRAHRRFATLAIVVVTSAGCPEVNPEFVEPSSGGSGSGTSAAASGTGSAGSGEPANDVTGGGGGTSSGSDPATGGPAGDCDQRFGDAPDYQLCEETARECRFAATVAGSDCAQLCSDLDSECVEAFDNPPPDAPDQCVVEGPSSCDTNVPGTQICVCVN